MFSMSVAICFIDAIFDHGAKIMGRDLMVIKMPSVTSHGLS
jgi:hypothetical protein